MALRRFIAFRGTPAVVYSDNGTNIKAGDKELAQGIANLNSARVYGEAADQASALLRPVLKLCFISVDRSAT
jgi:hypothetical protein